MKVLIAGDLYPQQRVKDLLDKGDYNEILGDTLPIIKDVDIAIVNLETPIVDDDKIKPIEKLGVCLKTSSKVIDLLKYAGFNVVTTANNHFFDYGEEGLKGTIKCLEENGIMHVGSGANLKSASSILYINIKGKKLAVINCCEHEFSIATEDTAGCNPLNPISQYYSIIEAKENADYVLVIVHGGNEHHQHPSPRMQDVYRFFIDVGADVVINHHQHCFCGYEIYKNKQIFYGLGNFCFDSDIDNKFRSPTWNEGFMVSLDFSENIKFKIFPYLQNTFDRVGVFGLGEIEINKFENRIYELNEIINNRDKLVEIHLNYLEKWKKSILLLFSPYRNKLLAYLFLKGFLPNFISEQYKKVLKNRLECESHFEKVMFAIRNR